MTHVVDVRMEWSDEQAVADNAPAVGYLHVGIDDAGQQVPYDFFYEGMLYALEALRDPKSIVGTHCHMRINRGVGFAVLLALGWNPIDTLTAIREARPIAAIGYEDAPSVAPRPHRRIARQPHGEIAQVATWRRNHLDVDTDHPAGPARRSQ